MSPAFHRLRCAIFPGPASCFKINTMKKMITAFMLFVCCITGFAQNKKTKGWQPGATFTVYNGPGMRPEWSKIIISDTACWYITGGDGPDVANRFTLKKPVLDSLLKYLTDNKFDQMHKHQRIALWYDKGTTAISLETGGNSIYATESHSMELEKGWHDKFYDILRYAYGLLAKAEK